MISVIRRYKCIYIYILIVNIAKCIVLRSYVCPEYAFYDIVSLTVAAILDRAVFCICFLQYLLAMLPAVLLPAMVWT